MKISHKNLKYKNIFDYLLKYSHNVSINSLKNIITIDDLDIGIYFLFKTAPY